MRMMLLYKKDKTLRHVGHLDLLRTMQRAFRRSGLPMAYSKGFNPHMKTSFGFPLSLGNESLGEYFDLEINEKIEVNDFINRMNNVLPKEMQILASEYSDDTESIMSRCFFVEYIVNIEFERLDIDKLNGFFDEMLQTGVDYERMKKNKKNKNVIKEIN